MEKEFATDDHPEMISASGGVVFTYFDRSDKHTKSASDAINRKDIADHMPPHTHFGVHLNSIGAEEAFGYNRNCDSTSQDALDKYHSTFEKFGCVFREHKNKSAEREGVGQVKLARVNKAMHRGELIVWVDKDKAPDMYKAAKAGKELSWSMSMRLPHDRCSCCDKKSKRITEYCFVPGTEITMADGTRRPISCIRRGDMVMDADGRITRVVAVSVREVDEEIVSIGNSLFGGDTRVTLNHPILALPAEAKHMAGLCNEARDKHAPDVPLCDLEVWSRFVPRPDFVAAEHLRYGDFLFAPVLRHDVSLWDGFCDADDAWVYGLFIAEGSYGKQTRTDGTVHRVSLQFSLHEDELGYIDRLRIYFKTRYDKDLKVYASECSKGVSARIFSKDIAEHFMSVCGEYAAKKTLDVRFMHAPDEIVAALLKGIYDGDGHMCADKGTSRINLAARNLLCQIWHLHARAGHLSYIGRSMNPSGPQSRAAGYTNMTPVFYLNSSYPYGDSMASGRRMHDGRVEGYVRSTRLETYKGPVHNLETESHTYVADGLAVHNCNHLKDKMGKLVPEFRKYAYARNEDNVKYFDISEVKRRADRIATYLGYMFHDGDMAKAASIDDVLITGAEWAAFNNPRTEVVGFSPWEMLTLTKLAAAEQFIRHADSATLGTLAAARPRALSTANIEALAQPDFRSVGGELAKAAMVLDFAAFASLVTAKPIEELRKEAAFRDVEGLKLPSLMSDMNEREGCECCEEATDAVAPDEWGCSFSAEKDSIDQLISAVGDDLGMKPQQVTNRALSCMGKAASVPTIRSATRFDPFYAAMAEAYGYYAVKAAHVAKDVPGVSENTLFREIAAMQFFRA